MPSPSDLDRAVRAAAALYKHTRDPLLPSALRLLATAQADALLAESYDYDLTRMQSVAYTLVEHLENAFFTLYGYPLDT